jgi:hypothetical protein
MPRYRVMVDDNFHYQDEGERREHGVYETLEEARAACRALVDRSLAAEYRPGISAEKLFDRYKSFGEDPFILPVDGGNEGVLFSAWTYAEERCGAICGA